ncbi:MAG: bifunctional (p)ppGpp synthetase/guanosine-3',5'-bis(diphosphate) 3'-pyrophosphohydrolase [Chlorobi bacterium]|nr:bifunctional (p)ppGpp synthetase/guanosine-3',5'-bis(diphosphate) 3'-pyrophosphohydrolase [Chlorobiota bacterium]
MSFLHDTRLRRLVSGGSVKKEDSSSDSPDLKEFLEACRNSLREYDEPLIRNAYEYAREAHKHSFRKSGEPYFSHPLAVARIILHDIPFDSITVASALLHDVVEDTEYTYDDIRSNFGTVVADIVEGVTKISKFFENKQLKRAENYRKLLASMVNDLRVILVKIADRLHNMRTLEHHSRVKQVAIAKETLDLYAPLAHRFGLARIKWELEDLAFKYLHPLEYEDLKLHINEKREEREKYIEKFAKPIVKRLKERGLQFEISGRPKHLYSIYQKMVNRNKPITEIYDLFAIRIILDTEDDNECFSVYGIVTDIYRPIPERFKNYINLPKQNGYRSIHTTVSGPNGRKVEVQIRTREMHEVAEIGVAAHWLYKERKSARKSSFEDWVASVREVFENPLYGASKEESAEVMLKDLMRSLYQDEIVVFTPKGDDISLPAGATALDFAFAIHSELGLRCIGAKVNHRIVPLGTKLKSGDQVEIITSKNHSPGTDWDKLVTTHKAHTAIRRWYNEQSRHIADKGRDIFRKKARKQKVKIAEDELERVARQLGFKSPYFMFVALGNGDLDFERIVNTHRGLVEQDTEALPQPKGKEELFEDFIRSARDSQAFLIDGKETSMQFEYAKCCNPIPGDDIIGFITKGGTLKIHRRDCINIEHLMIDATVSDPTIADRLIPVTWPRNGESTYLAGIKVIGDDRPGILNEISLAISNYRNTNIRSVSIDTKEGSFFGSIVVSVRDLDHLNHIISRILKVKGIKTVERYDEM